ncbi:MAG: hypothetical protein ABIH89_00480 [Elusimicrobiota bacterium]
MKKYLIFMIVIALFCSPGLYAVGDEHAGSGENLPEMPEQHQFHNVSDAGVTQDILAPENEDAALAESANQFSQDDLAIAEALNWHYEQKLAEMLEADAKQAKAKKQAEASKRAREAQKEAQQSQSSSSED